MAFAHIVAVCDDPQIQNMLPQLILARRTNLSHEACQAPELEFAKRIFALRLGRAWSATQVIRELFVRLQVALRELRNTHELIVFADAFKAHTSIVFENAQRGLDLDMGETLLGGLLGRKNL